MRERVDLHLPNAGRESYWGSCGCGTDKPVRIEIHRRYRGQVRRFCRRAMLDIVKHF
jgi:hypothetical protein